MVAYRHAEDIDTEYSVNAEEVDDKVERLVHPLALAFERSEDLSTSFRHLLSDQLRQFLDTHRSIRLLMKQRGEDLAAASDAMSLAREQIDKDLRRRPALGGPRRVDDALPQGRLAQGLRALPARRGRARRAPTLPRVLLRLRPRAHGKGTLAARRNRGRARARQVPVPQPRRRIPRLKASAEILQRFPTAARVIKKVSDDTLKDGLGRWYHEYGYFSGYSHAGFPKLMARYYEASKKYTSSQKEEAVEKEYDQALWASYLAAATACAEAGLRELPRVGGAPARVADLDVHVKLEELWVVMRRATLLGKALWELQVRHLMPPILGTPAGAIS